MDLIELLSAIKLSPTNNEKSVPIDESDSSIKILVVSNIDLLSGLYLRAKLQEKKERYDYIILCGPFITPAELGSSTSSCSLTSLVSHFETICGQVIYLYGDTDPRVKMHPDLKDQEYDIGNLTTNSVDATEKKYMLHDKIYIAGYCECSVSTEQKCQTNSSEQNCQSNSSEQKCQSNSSEQNCQSNFSEQKCQSETIADKIDLNPINTTNITQKTIDDVELLLSRKKRMLKKTEEREHKSTLIFGINMKREVQFKDESIVPNGIFLFGYKYSESLISIFKNDKIRNCGIRLLIVPSIDDNFDYSSLQFSDDCHVLITSPFNKTGKYYDVNMDKVGSTWKVLRVEQYECNMTEVNIKRKIWMNKSNKFVIKNLNFKTRK